MIFDHMCFKYLVILLWRKILNITLYKIYKQYPIICTDTREVKKGGIFFALKGENFNGNKFANVCDIFCLSFHHAHVQMVLSDKEH